MHDLGFVRANLELVEKKLRERGMDPAAVLGDFRALDQRRRERITESEELKAQRNKLSEEVARLKKSGLDAGAVMEETRALKTRMDELDALAVSATAEMINILIIIPNLCRDEVPVGGDERSNVEAKRWGKVREFEFQPKPHWELGEQLGILDLERAAKISGARFAV
ncbi:MAG: serine--tRNA ligase, partial [Acidobacteriaceae bacterium]